MPAGAGGAWVGVDPGDVRTGVSASDRHQVLASPVTTLARGEAVSGVVTVVLEREAVGVVVGLPISLSGQEGTSAARARSYASELAAAVACPVYLVDERLTTVAAAGALRAGGHDGRSARRVVDQAAATALLQGVLDAAASRALDCAAVLDSGLGQRVSAPVGDEPSDRSGGEHP
jgi:putative Holliday junction resolvase